MFGGWFFRGYFIAMAWAPALALVWSSYEELQPGEARFNWSIGHTIAMIVLVLFGFLASEWVSRSSPGNNRG